VRSSTSPYRKTSDRASTRFLRKCPILPPRGGWRDQRASQVRLCAWLHHAVASAHRMSNLKPLPVCHWRCFESSLSLVIECCVGGAHTGVPYRATHRGKEESKEYFERGKALSQIVAYELTPGGVEERKMRLVQSFRLRDTRAQEAAERRASARKQEEGKRDALEANILKNNASAPSLSTRRPPATQSLERASTYDQL
jgi:hypothetical protein